MERSVLVDLGVAFSLLGVLLWRRRKRRSDGGDSREDEFDLSPGISGDPEWAVPPEGSDRNTNPFQKVEGFRPPSRGGFENMEGPSPHGAAEEAGMPRSRASSALAVAVLLLAALAVFTPREVSAYIPHPPIAINGNADFTPANGVTGGSGTPADPYVIEGWEIDASTATGIDIRNTDSYALIRGNYVYSGFANATTWFGIYVAMVRFVSIEDNILSSNHIGIRSDASQFLTVTGNNITDSHIGINFQGTADAHVLGNQVSGSRAHGMLLTTATNVTIEGNDLWGNFRGISIGGSIALKIRGNRLTGGGVVLSGSSPPSSNLPFINSHTITPDNLVNGKPLLYYKDCTCLSVDDVPVGQLIVANCAGVVARRLEIADTDEAIQLLAVRDLVLAENRITSSYVGIAMAEGRNVAMTGNVVQGNDWGLFLRYGTNVTVAGSDLSDNSLIGLYVDVSEGVQVTGNRASGNGQVGLSLGVVLRGVTVHGNDVSNNREGGIYGAGQSWNVTVTSNDVLGNRRLGIAYSSVENLTLEGNRVSAYEEYGMQVGNSENVTVLHNNVSFYEQGIYVYNTVGATVHRNVLWQNGLQGFDDRGAANAWDGGYPGGGNSWSDYTGIDQCSGPNQDVCPDPDGIGDTPRVLDPDSRDRYPLIAPPSWNRAPVPALAVDRNPVAPGQQAVITANGSFDSDGSIVSYRFSFGDGTETGGGTTPYAAHAWNAPGIYGVTLTVTDDRGATYQESTVVGVCGEALDLSPVALARRAPPSGNLDTDFAFDGSDSWDTEGAIVAYRWDFGDGAIATSIVATHRYPTRGTFAVTLTVWDSSGKSDTDSVGVEVRNRPPTAAAGPDRTVEVGTSVQLEGVGSDADGDPVSFSWTRTAGPFASLAGQDSASPTFSAVEPGAYTFELTVDDGFGGTATDTVTIVVSAAPPDQGMPASPWPWIAALGLAVAFFLVAAFLWRRRRRKDEA